MPNREVGAPFEQLQKVLEATLSTKFVYEIADALEVVEMVQAGESPYAGGVSVLEGVCLVRHKDVILHLSSPSYLVVAGNCI